MAGIVNISGERAPERGHPTAPHRGARAPEADAGAAAGARAQDGAKAGAAA